MLTLQGLILQNKGVKREPKPNNGLHIYDTLERKVLPITASDGQVVRIYCCGPTVYRDAHVGNLRTFLLSDLVRRTLEFSGLKVKMVQNITDVGHMSEDFEEDKMLAQSKLEKRDPYSIAINLSRNKANFKIRRNIPNNHCFLKSGITIFF